MSDTYWEIHLEGENPKPANKNIGLVKQAYPEFDDEYFEGVHGHIYRQKIAENDIEHIMYVHTSFMLNGNGVSPNDVVFRLPTAAVVIDPRNQAQIYTRNNEPPLPGIQEAVANLAVIAAQLRKAYPSAASMAASNKKAVRPDKGYAAQASGVEFVVKG